jgi:DNA-binding MarR family transcriptional regulator
MRAGQLDAGACSDYLRPMTDEPCESAVRAWSRLMRAHQAALGHVEAALKAADLPPLGWYDVLVELERAGDCGLRPVALERDLLLPQYGLSRLIARMEEAGLVRRSSCPGDGRGQMVAITDAGRAARRAMWLVYGAALQAAVGRRLSPSESEGLADLLGRLIEPPRAPAADAAGR